MSFLMTLAGFEKALTFEVGFNSTGGLVGVKTRATARVLGVDYIRLWACYQAKVAYRLGYPENPDARLAIQSVRKVIEHELGTDTDCLRRAGFADTIGYSPEVPTTGPRLTGALYAKGRLDRRITARFPAQGAPRQAVYSALALMQHAVGQNICDSDGLAVLERTARNLVHLYETSIGVGLTSVVRVPALAYRHAIEATG